MSITDQNDQETGQGGSPVGDPSLYVPIVLAGIGVVGILVYALQFIPSEGSFVLGTISVGSVTGAAAMMTGGLLGFLLGTPRTIFLSTGRTGPASGAVVVGALPAAGMRASSAQAVGSQYEPNTNLEQISDWLVKILIGVGLTQIGDLPSRLHVLAAFLGRRSATLPPPNLSRRCFWSFRDHRLYPPVSCGRASCCQCHSARPTPSAVNARIILDGGGGGHQGHRPVQVSPTSTQMHAV